MLDSVVNYWGTGRRKNAVARVLLRVGNGRVTINDREVDDYLPRFFWKTQAMEPLKVAGVEGRVDIIINAHGGGLTGQSGAIRMGIARAILKLNPDSRPALKRAGMLRRDSRMVERKKFGQKGARGKRQFSKR
ncbi:MAG: 30S ribosomal protein S9 [Synergistaceae bacterium]|jgi:small subunit ribosomal protein S9|nr:30S ribosomal protein S9 [Synergistaceae bacterium]